MLPTPFFDEVTLRKLERLAVLTRRAASGQLQGERRSNRRGQSVEFADYRQYVRGDDFRRIDWNAYARLERFFIKLFVEERELTVHIFIDNSRSMDWGEPNKLDYARRAAAALGYIALLGLDRVTIRSISVQQYSPAFRLPPLRGKNQAQTLFTFLQALTPSPSAPLQEQNIRSSAGEGTLDASAAQPERYGNALANPLIRQLSAYAANTPNPGPLLLFSDLMDDGWRDGLNALASRGFEITLLHMLSPDEIQPEIAGDFRLVDSENGSEVEISADFETLQRYKEHLAAWQEDWRRFCVPRGVNYLAISSDLPLEDLLFAKLRRKGLLR